MLVIINALILYLTRTAMSCSASRHIPKCQVGMCCNSTGFPIYIKLSPTSPIKHLRKDPLLEKTAEQRYNGGSGISLVSPIASPPRLCYLIYLQLLRCHDAERTY